MQEIRGAHARIYEHQDSGLIWQTNGDLSTATPTKQAHHLPAPYSTNTDNLYAPATTSLTEPKISSIKVLVYELDMWEDDWYDRHCQHSDPEGDYGPDFQWQAFPDWDPEIDEGGMQLVKWWCERRARTKRVRLAATAARE